MYKRFRERFGTAGLIVAVVALILALTGAAFAAAGLNSKQKKEVTKIAKKYAGKPGALGVEGKQGPEGKSGANGSNGENGKDGESVTLAAATSCANGGTKLTVGGEEAEVCNGTNGTNGTNGSDGKDAGFEYLFNADTANSDPGSGKLKLDNATPASATTVRISETDNNSVGIAAAIATWVSGAGAKGTLMIRKVGAPATFAQYAIKTNVDAGAFDNLTVVFVAGNGSFADNDPVTVAYSASGTATLPLGKTETGAWSAIGSLVGGPVIVAFPISFTIPLEAELDSAHVHFMRMGEGPAPGCTGGTPAAPRAASGNLCVYTGVEEEGGPLAIVKVSQFIAGASTSGAILFTEFFEGKGYMWGSWAVTG